MERIRLFIRKIKSAIWHFKFGFNQPHMHYNQDACILYYISSMSKDWEENADQFIVITEHQKREVHELSELIYRVVEDGAYGTDLYDDKFEIKMEFTDIEDDPHDLGLSEVTMNFINNNEDEYKKELSKKTQNQKWTYNRMHYLLKKHLHRMWW